MNVKKLLLAFIYGAIAMTVIDVLWYQGIMKDWYLKEFSDIIRAEDQIQWLWDVLGYYIGILLMAYIFPIGYKGGKPVEEGLKFGIIIGLIMHLPVQFVLYAHYTLPLTGTLVNVLFQVVEKTIGGIVIALVYARGPKAT